MWWLLTLWCRTDREDNDTHAPAISSAIPPADQDDDQPSGTVRRVDMAARLQYGPLAVEVSGRSASVPFNLEVSKG